jgi:hypothetical protein
VGFDSDELNARLQVQASLESTSGAVTTLEFTGFDACPLTSESVHDTRAMAGGIMVTFTRQNLRAASDDANGGSAHAVSPFGKPDGRAADVLLELGGIIGIPRNADPHRALIRKFGRVLGFPYEWVRGGENDAPSRCPESLPPDPHRSARIPEGLVDYGSIMDRCAPPAYGAFLSPGDVIAAQAIYGTKHPGAIVSGGECLTILPSYALGVDLCTYKSQDTWERHETTRFIRLSRRPAASGQRALRARHAGPTDDSNAGLRLVPFQIKST